jgi:hypothetical protein
MKKAAHGLAVGCSGCVVLGRQSCRLRLTGHAHGDVQAFRCSGAEQEPDGVPVQDGAQELAVRRVQDEVQELAVPPVPDAVPGPQDETQGVVPGPA